ncbi:hypothetical protein Dimus_007094 [Dionaea muscipula]
MREVGRRETGWTKGASVAEWAFGRSVRAGLPRTGQETNTQGSTRAKVEGQRGRYGRNKGPTVVAGQGATVVAVIYDCNRTESPSRTSPNRVVRARSIGQGSWKTSGWMATTVTGQGSDGRSQTRNAEQTRPGRVDRAELRAGVRADASRQGRSGRRRRSAACLLLGYRRPRQSKAGERVGGGTSAREHSVRSSTRDCGSELGEPRQEIRRIWARISRTKLTDLNSGEHHKPLTT